MAWWVVVALAVVLGVGPQHHLVVCTATARCGAGTVAVAPACCSGGCCSAAHGDAANGDASRGDAAHRAAPASGVPRPGDPLLRADRPPCCVDVCLGLGPAPLPRADAIDAPGPMHWPRTCEPRGATQAGWRTWQWPHDTGPPRVDRRTSLLASTVLLV